MHARLLDFAKTFQLEESTTLALQHLLEELLEQNPPQSGTTDPPAPPTERAENKEAAAAQDPTDQTTNKSTGDPLAKDPLAIAPPTPAPDALPTPNAQPKGPQHPNEDPNPTPPHEVAHVESENAPSEDAASPPMPASPGVPSKPMFEEDTLDVMDYIVPPSEPSNKAAKALSSPPKDAAETDDTKETKEARARAETKDAKKAKAAAETKDAKAPRPGQLRDLQEIPETDEITDAALVPLTEARLPAASKEAQAVEATTLSMRPSSEQLTSVPAAIANLDMPPLPPEERYELLQSIGTGGMGRVYRVRDWRLKRVLAMKILHPNWLRHPEWVHRFIEEAQATAQLQHPGIVPVHDLGQFADGRFYFTMKEIIGRTLSVVIKEVHKATDANRWDMAASGWSYRRLIDVFHRVCEAVAYAHSFGILHRDLKPENVMVGEHGEVKVVDWGLVKMSPHSWNTPSASLELVPDAMEASEPPAQPAGPHATQHGEVKGTPAYMSPEQAGGDIDRISPATDVYGLGAILYEILSGEPPYSGRDVRTVLFRILSEPPLPPGRLESGRTWDGMNWKHDPSTPKPLDGPMLPWSLVRICDKALARNPEDRFADAGELAHEIEQWLEGAQKRARAEELVEEARLLLPSASTLRQQAEKQRNEALERLTQVGPWESEAKKNKDWHAIDEATNLEWEAWMIELEAEQKLQAALSHARDSEAAHLTLVKHYEKLHREAEAERRAYSQMRAARYLQSHAEALPQEHPVHQSTMAYLSGDGALSLHTDPPGAEVLLYRYVTENRRAKPVFLRFLGETPLKEIKLAMGSYLLVLRKDGFEEVRYPVSLDRMEHWTGIPPNQTEPLPIRLLPNGSLAANECYVPAGWFWAGGDREAINALPRQRLWADPFIIQRFSNTNTQVIAFLDDLVAQGKEHEALRYAPRERAGSSEEQGALIYGRTPEGGFVLRPDTEGDIWFPNYPALMIDWYGAQAFARWFSQKTHRPWRLPAELEWEKAARGVDGRFYPWGDYLDPSWCCMRESRPKRPLPSVIGTHEEDQSPYGVRELAGNVRDWCLDIFRSHGPRIEDQRVQIPLAAQRPDDTIEEDASHILRVRRGGGWELNSKLCRVAGRDGDNPTNRDYMSGFRLVRSLW